MSDFFNPSQTRKARNAHRCTYCSEAINKGDCYTFQKGNQDGQWFENKMHPECFDDAFSWGDDYFTPFSNERPRVTGDKT